MLKRLFDIIMAGIGILLLSPVLLLISILIFVSSKGGVLYFQSRIGKNRVPFNLIKFRTMHVNSEQAGLLTVGGRDPRITSIGFYLRKYKLDELPQLLNVFFGSMSLVGPRPEVKKYVDLYNDEQLKVLTVRPGITDYASLEYFSENDLLAKSSNPEQTYIEEVMPAKLKLNSKYIQEAGLLTDLKVILKTLLKIIKH